MRNLKVEGEGIIDAMRNLLKSGQAKKINGMLVDFYSASMVVQTYDAVSQATKDKILKMDVERMVASVYAANSAARKTP